MSNLHDIEETGAEYEEWLDAKEEAFREEGNEDAQLDAFMESRLSGEC